MFNPYNLDGINQYVFSQGSIDFPASINNPKIIKLDSLSQFSQQCPFTNLIDQLIKLKIESNVIDCFAKQWIKDDLEVLKAYPKLELEDIKQALNYAAWL